MAKNRELKLLGIASGVILSAIALRLAYKHLWTDFNTHDPGVTQPELLNYSLDDLRNSGKDKLRKHKREAKI